MAKGDKTSMDNIMNNSENQQSGQLDAEVTERSAQTSPDEMAATESAEKPQTTAEVGMDQLMEMYEESLKRGEEKADFDQQPVEVAALIDANWQAYKATESRDYLENIYVAFNWFLGKNDLGVTLYDFRSGGCRDGLHPSRVNENEGAESTLSWLMSLQRMYKLMGELKSKPEEVHQGSGATSG